MSLYGEHLGRLDEEERKAKLAACALLWNATLWTLNTSDFHGVPGLRLRGG